MRNQTPNTTSTDAPPCGWVRERLAAFYAWDPCLGADDLDAIDAHLERCPECALEWEHTREILDRIEDERIANDSARLSADELCESLNARIDELESVAHVVPVRTAPRRRWRWAAAAALLLGVLPALAYFGPKVWRSLTPEINAPDASETADPLAPENVNSILDANPLNSAVDAQRSHWPYVETHGAANLQAPPPEIFERRKLELPPGELDRWIVETEVAGMFPHTDEQWEAWARKEYPQVLWLYDKLVEDFDYQGEWQKLLIDSGEVHRFDWPLADDAPNVKPRIAGLLAAARAVGYTPVLTPNGEFDLPRLKWADEQKPGAEQRLRLSRAKAPIPGPIPDPAVPDDYIEKLAEHPASLKSALAYLTASSRLTAEKHTLGRQLQFSQLADNTQTLLHRVALQEHLMHQSAPHDQCKFPALTGELRDVLNVRIDILAKLSRLAMSRNPYLATEIMKGE